MTGINDKIIDLIKGRLEKGANTYKQQVQLEDKRDFTKETLEEVLDAAVYSAAKLIQLKEVQKKREIRIGTVIKLIGTGYLTGIYYKYRIIKNGNKVSGLVESSHYIDFTRDNLDEIEIMVKGWRVSYSVEIIND